MRKRLAKLEAVCRECPLCGDNLSKTMHPVTAAVLLRSSLVRRRLLTSLRSLREHWQNSCSEPCSLRALLSCGSVGVSSPLQRRGSAVHSATQNFGALRSWLVESSVLANVDDERNFCATLHYAAQLPEIAEHLSTMLSQIPHNTSEDHSHGVRTRCDVLFVSSHSDHTLAESVVRSCLATDEAVDRRCVVLVSGVLRCKERFSTCASMWTQCIKNALLLTDRDDDSLLDERLSGVSIVMLSAPDDDLAANVPRDGELHASVILSTLIADGMLRSSSGPRQHPCVVHVWQLHSDSLTTETVQKHFSHIESAADPRGVRFTCKSLFVG